MAQRERLALNFEKEIDSKDLSSKVFFYTLFNYLPSNASRIISYFSNMKMKITTGIALLSMGLLLLFYSSCQKEATIINGNTEFPNEIQKIFQNKCATSGCHNDKSFQNAAGLNLTTWENLVYKGGVSGSVVIPFRPENSSLFQFCNTYPDLGLMAEPSMPLNANPLSRDEIKTIKDWIKDGCKNKNGEIPFANDFATRKKIYLSNQGCDLLSVIDAKTKLVMRYIPIGSNPNPAIIEVPHFLDMSADGEYFYACFTEGDVVQKFNARTGDLVGQVNIGPGAWNVIKLTPDGNTAYVSGLTDPGKIAKVNTQTMTLEFMFQGTGLFSNPHGIAISQNGQFMYVTAQYGNFFYKFNPNIVAAPQKISLVKGETPTTTPNTYDPHEVIFSPDYSKYFFTCQSSNEVRVFDATADTLLKVIPVGKFPLEFAISNNKNYLFISCSEEPNPNFPSLKGSVEVIDLNSLNIVKTLYGKFYQPHGMVVDEERNQLYVGSRNSDPSGPPPHHVSECGGKNGYYEVFDINTWNVITTPKEVSVDPYSMIITP